MENDKIVVLTEESYTSKCDALSLEPICRHDSYLGKRTKRGLFESSQERLINADINGAINIMRKVYRNIDIITRIRIENLKRIKIFREVQDQRIRHYSCATFNFLKLELYQKY